jgi:hypothetical protein
MTWGEIGAEGDFLGMFRHRQDVKMTPLRALSSAAPWPAAAPMAKQGATELLAGTGSAGPAIWETLRLDPLQPCLAPVGI